MFVAEITLKPSKQFMTIIVLLIVSAVAALVLLAIPRLIQVMLIACVLSSGGYIFWQHGLLQGSRAMLQVIRQADGQWRLKTRASTMYGELSGDSTVTIWVCILRFKVQGQGIYSAVVFNDAVDRESYRRFLVALRAPMPKKSSIP